MDNILGIEIGGTKLQIFVGGSDGKITQRYRFSVGDGGNASTIRETITDVLGNRILPQHRIDAVGVGFGGPVDVRTGQVINSFQISGWAGFNLLEWLEQEAGVPVYIDNDANLAAYAEACKGVGRGVKRIFYNTLGSGCGGGFVYDGEIYHGVRAGEFEFGHMKLQKDGMSVESQCSGWAVNKKVKAAKMQHPESILARCAASFDGHDAKALDKALEKNCDVAEGILLELADNLAFAYSHVVHLLNPDKIIIGGGLSLMGKILPDTIQKRLSTYVVEALVPGPDICIAELGEDAVVVGALLLAGRKLKNIKSN